jgi:hypothetical protein
MSLSIVVGILANCIAQKEDEAVGVFESRFARVNEVLREEGLPEHHEPRDLKGRKPWGYSNLSYGDLHRLRRLAAHVRLRFLQADGNFEPFEEWPAPCDPGVTPTEDNDPVLADYYQEGLDALFDHLCWHSDFEGFYLPADFSDVIVPRDELFDGVGGYIGSSRNLQIDCEWVAQVIGLPLHLDPNGKLFRDTVQGERGEGWWMYPRECEMCLKLYIAAQASLELGAAIVFQG